MDPSTSSESEPTIVRVNVEDLENVVSRLSRLHERGGVLPAEEVWFDGAELSRYVVLRFSAS